MATRYIGDAVVTITYRDRGDYKGKICVPGHQTASGATHCWHFESLYAPRAGLGSGVAYDSAIAYDKMAEAAAGFGSYEDDQIGDAVNVSLRDNGTYEVRRQRHGRIVNPTPKGRTSNPFQRNPLSQVWGKR